MLCLHPGCIRTYQTVQDLDAHYETHFPAWGATLADDPSPLIVNGTYATQTGLYSNGADSYAGTDFGFYHANPSYVFPGSMVPTDMAPNNMIPYNMVTSNMFHNTTPTNDIVPTAPAIHPPTQQSKKGTGSQPRPRPSCQICNRSFTRASDLERHMNKHVPGTKVYQCNVQGCDYGGSYRKDKLKQHQKNCH